MSKMVVTCRSPPLHFRRHAVGPRPRGPPALGRPLLPPCPVAPPRKCAGVPHWGPGVRTTLHPTRPGAGSMRGDVSAALNVRATDLATESFEELRAAAEAIASAGAEVVRAALDKPRTIDEKMSSSDIVTDTDKASEAACLAELTARFPDHAVLGEEGGVSGDTTSEYLWCIDPLDGTSNFAHGYPSFAVSVACVWRGEPVAACVVEFTGGRYCWASRTFTATKGGGARCQGESIQVSPNAELPSALLVTGFGYDHDEPWAANMETFKHFTDVTRGVRRLGAAAVDMCHVSLGIVDAYWEYNLKPWDVAAGDPPPTFLTTLSTPGTRREYNLKPWDVAAGVLIVSEAGGKVTTMTGAPFSVFDRSLLVSNGALHGKILGHIAPVTVKLIEDGTFDPKEHFRPDGYMADGC